MGTPMDIALAGLALMAIAVIAFFIFSYTKTYQWYRNTLGIAMNASLIANAITFGGAILAIFGISYLGFGIMALGILTFIISILWRWHLMETTARLIKDKARIKAEIKAELLDEITEELPSIIE